MTAMLIFILTIVLSYLAGSIPAAVWIGRAVKGIDVRAHGSGNMGATNAARVLGLPWGIATGLLDIAKGFAPVVWLGPIAAQHSVIGLPEARLLLGVIAISGHLFPIFAGFKGGKGVMTSLGVFVSLLPFDVGIGVAVWVIVFAATRIVSLGSMLAVVALAASVALRRFVFAVPIADSHLWAAVLLAVMVLYTHRANIRRLLAGDEYSFRRHTPG